LHQLHVGLVPADPDLSASGGFSTALACPLFALPFLFFGFGFAWLTSLICVNFSLKMSVEVHLPATLAASVRMRGLVKPGVLFQM
jgi:hypothetical protein